MSKGVTFYFVRHGETFFNFYGRMQGWSNALLTEEGIKNVHRSGRGLADIEFDAVYTSDLKRTIDTASIILEENKYNENLEIVQMPEFREVHFGSFEGLSSAEVWPEVEQRVNIKHGLPEGSDIQIQDLMNMFKEVDPYHFAENYTEFWNRVESGLLKLLNRHAGTDQNILVVCHGMTIRNLLDGLIADFDKTDALQNASVSIVKYQHGRFEMLAYNQVEHFKDVADDAAND
ncbi:histidine phosphatase family protein [Aerococcaceae bacterium DSM 111021]|nr:histidine phosphatase family protein [Aerococcaceae bacterium DSM 111021]